jgi:5-methylcytosine-specific restriction endonuclease McrA
MTSFTLAEYEARPSVFEISIGHSARRRKPPKRIQDQIIAEQGLRCKYCYRSVGPDSPLRPHWDHFIPYAYCGGNPDDNWILSCHVCNAVKGSKVFDSVEDVREYIGSCEAP